MQKKTIWHKEVGSHCYSRDATGKLFNSFVERVWESLGEYVRGETLVSSKQSLMGNSGKDSE